MPDLSPDPLTFHTRFRRRAHGCLPLFVAGAFAFVFALLWLVPVQKPEPLRPRGVGEVLLSDDETVDFMVRAQSPLPLLQPRTLDPDFDEIDRMPLKPELKPQPAPPAPLFGAPDSAVLDAESLLQLPPESLLPSNNGKEVAE